MTKFEWYQISLRNISNPLFACFRNHFKLLFFHLSIIEIELRYFDWYKRMNKYKILKIPWENVYKNKLLISTSFRVAFKSSIHERKNEPQCIFCCSCCLRFPIRYIHRTKGRKINDSSWMNRWWWLKNKLNIKMCFII